MLTLSSRTCTRLCHKVKHGSRWIHIAATDADEYHENGAVCLRDVISEHWVEQLREAAALLEALPGPCGEYIQDASCEYFTDLEMAQHLELNQFAEFVHQGPSAAIAGELMRANKVCFLYDQYFRQQWFGSEAGAPSTASARTPWHQDQPYWQITGSMVATVWLPLDPTPAGSSVQFVVGSHKWPECNPFHFATGKPYECTGLPELPDIGAGVRARQFEVVSWDCEPGDVVVFNGMTVHGQLEKSTEGTEGVKRQFRRLATRWTGDDVRYVLRDGEARDVIPSQHNPCTLQPGDELECERFPLVWTQEHGLRPRDCG